MANDFASLLEIFLSSIRPDLSPFSMQPDRTRVNKATPFLRNSLLFIILYSGFLSILISTMKRYINIKLYLNKANARIHIIFKNGKDRLAIPQPEGSRKAGCS